MTLAMPTSRAVTLLSDPTFRMSVVRVVRKRVADDQAVQDIVQEAFTDAYAHESRLPADDRAAKKYLFGIVRNKIRMHIRRWVERTHESFDEEVHGQTKPPPFYARYLLRKIVADVPLSQRETLTWFVRVNTIGDSLADVAREAGVNYDTAHKRYARLRDDMRRRAHKLATTASAALLAVGILSSGAERPAIPDRAPAPQHVVPYGPTPEQEDAAQLRRAAFAACDAHRWTQCLEQFDEARRIDPAGDAADDVRAATRAAREGLERMREGLPQDVVWDVK
jgi:DNA-directed RNA polymerase specialized sigma24 family protein